MAREGLFLAKLDMVTFLLGIWWKSISFILKIISLSHYSFKVSYSLLRFHVSEQSNEGLANSWRQHNYANFKWLHFIHFKSKFSEICVKFKVSSVYFFIFFIGIKHINTFQWNKFHSKISYGVKHIDKIYELSLISSSLSTFWPTFNHNTISINPNLKCFSAKICQHIYQS